MASHLDQVALYGGGPSANQPTGLINVPGVAQGVPIDSADLHGSFCALKARIEAADVNMTNYSVIVSPAEQTNLAHHSELSRRIDYHLGRVTYQFA